MYGLLQSFAPLLRQHVAPKESYSIGCPNAEGISMQKMFEIVCQPKEFEKASFRFFFMPGGTIFLSIPMRRVLVVVWQPKEIRKSSQNDSPLLSIVSIRIGNNHVFFCVNHTFIFWTLIFTYFILLCLYCNFLSDISQDK